MFDTTLHGFQQWYDGLQHNISNSTLNWFERITFDFEETRVKLNMSDKIQVYHPGYFEKLGMLLNKTAVRTIVNYIHWNFISFGIPLLFTNETKNFQNDWVEQKIVEDENAGPSEIAERQVFCVSLGSVKEIAEYAYLKKYLTDEIEEQVMEMTANIRQEHVSNIRASAWLDNETRNFLLEKVENTPVVLNYPNFYKNATIMDTYYDGLVIDSSFFDNMIRYEKFTRKRRLELLGQEVHPESFRILPDTLDLNPCHLEIDIRISPAVLHHPLFDLQRPSYLNYGYIGSMISHELSHIFNDFVRFYSDRKGNTEQQQRTKWPPVESEVYNRSVNCFIEQYANYYSNLTSDNVSAAMKYGKNTRNENIADTIGTQAAFGAFKRNEKRYGQSQKIPGLEKLNNDQLFFLTFANLFCDNQGPKEMRDYRKYRYHSAHPLRIMGALSNSEEFAAAFQCPSHSPMNPNRKCNIWK